MNLSSTSSAFLYKLAQELPKVHRDGPEWQPEGLVLLIGNGGSAAVVSHIANDINKSKIACAIVPDYATLTCFANDYGWDHALEEWVRRYEWLPITLVAVSSSGCSNNIINACLHIGRERLITLTGFNAHNPVRGLGRINYYVPSDNYGIVEICHLAILHSLVNPGALD